MKFKTFTLRTNLLSKLLLSLALLIGSVDVWAEKTLPYSYNFVNNDLVGEGWIMTDCNASTGIMAASLTYPAKTGSYLFRFYGQSSAQYLISPEIANSDTGVEVSFYYNANASVAGTRNFSIGYSTTNTEISSFTFIDFNSIPVSDKNYHLLTSSCPKGTKYVAIKYNSNYNIYIDDITIEAQETYKKPKNLIVDSYTSTSVTLSWTVGRDEAAWQISYSTNPDFIPGTSGLMKDVDSNPATIDGLTDGAIYHVAIRSIYDDGVSEWTDKIEVKPAADLTIYPSDVNENSNLPFNGANVSKAALTKGQFIIPLSELGDIEGKQITKLTFHSKNTSSSYETANWGNARFDIYLNTTTESSYVGTDYLSEGAKVATNAELFVSDYKMEVVFDTPFVYSSNNLLITFIQTEQGTNKSISWYGKSGTYSVKTGLSTYSSTTYQYYFTPRITFTTESTSIPVTLGTNGYATFACPRPLDLTAENLPSGLKAYKAAVGGSRVYFTEVDQAVAANTGVLLEGAPEGNYDIPVADSGTSLEGVNDFLVNSIGGTFSNDEDYTYYALKKNSSPLVFGTFNPSTAAIPTNKAYLKVENEYAVKGLTFEFDNPTAVQSIKEAQPAMKGAVYDLSGRRVACATNAQLPKGLYIIDGKKVVIK